MEVLTRDEVLMVLNDHCGEQVIAVVEMFDETPVMSCAGRLLHWGEELPQVAAALGDKPWRERMEGHYVVGDGAITVSAEHFERARRFDAKLVVDLAPNACLVVRWTPEE